MLQYLSRQAIERQRMEEFGFVLLVYWIVSYFFEVAGTL